MDLTLCNRIGERSRSMPKIFISHAEKDAKLLVQPFIDLLIMGLNIDRNEIYYTSGGDIPTGSNFPNHIRDHITTAELVIVLNR